MAEPGRPNHPTSSSFSSLQERGGSWRPSGHRPTPCRSSADVAPLFSRCLSPGANPSYSFPAPQIRPSASFAITAFCPRPPDAVVAMTTDARALSALPATYEVVRQLRWVPLLRLRPEDRAGAPHHRPAGPAALHCCRDAAAIRHRVPGRTDVPPTPAHAVTPAVAAARPRPSPASPGLTASRTPAIPHARAPVRGCGSAAALTARRSWLRLAAPDPTPCPRGARAPSPLASTAASRCCRACAAPVAPRRSLPSRTPASAPPWSWPSLGSTPTGAPASAQTGWRPWPH
nr:translation initiation factor IF-2-like [Aegilops tauschii subsp. strangulata]